MLVFIILKTWKKQLSQMWFGMSLLFTILFDSNELWYRTEYQVHLAEIYMKYDLPEQAHQYYSRALNHYCQLANLTGKYLPKEISAKMTIVEQKIKVLKLQNSSENEQ